MNKYVIYIRVSTKRQGESGLGLEAQERDIALYFERYAEQPYEVLATFKDVQSGTKNNRKGYQEAVALAKKEGAYLLVAKLDRISRKVSTISAVMEEVKLKVAMMPNADNFQLHIYAALAEQEREFISERTKKALAVAKANGVKIGGARESTKERNEVTRVKTAEHYEPMRTLITTLKKQGMSMSQIAAALKENGYETSSGSTNWTHVQVSRLLKRWEKQWEEV